MMTEGGEALFHLNRERKGVAGEGSGLLGPDEVDVAGRVDAVLAGAVVAEHA